jgi:TfoX/Sxy family transcriptional regulator of competence genes
MAYDEKLAQRIRELLSERADVEEKKMFGGICYMVAKHMCCGIMGETLMARVGPDNYECCLAKAYTGVMNFTGKPMKGMVYVDPEGIRTRPQLQRWIDTCLDFVTTLPPKKRK